MSVIINDFEVVVEGEEAAGSPGAAAPQKAPAPSAPLTPMDIRDILRRQDRRQARVLAD